MANATLDAMPNPNGSPDIEHGYQDPRDQHDGNLADRATGYGVNNGQPGRDETTYRGGQSGARSGGRFGANPPYRGQGTQGGSPGHWGDMDQGGRYPGPHAGKGPQGYQRSDERIKELVHEALTDHGHVDATNIVVDVVKGEVTLTGTVDDRQTKRLAEDAVDGVSGVTEIHNQLRVKKPS